MEYKTYSSMLGYSITFITASNLRTSPCCTLTKNTSQLFYFVSKIHHQQASSTKHFVANNKKAHEEEVQEVSSNEGTLSRRAQAKQFSNGRTSGNELGLLDHRTFSARIDEDQRREESCRRTRGCPWFPSSTPRQRISGSRPQELWRWPVW